MKVLTAAEMREVDRRTIELGVPGLILMENAGHRVVEFLESRYGPLQRHRIAVFCGKGNNGGDGLVIARQLLTRFRPRRLDVLLAADPAELGGDAAANYRMFLACGGVVARDLEPAAQHATLVIDALLGTGLKGPAEGRYLDWIRAINNGFPEATVIAVDIPSGLPSDGPVDGECVAADATVTFTAPKLGQVIGPNYEHCGELVVSEIGSPASLFANASLHLTGTPEIAHLFRPRRRDSNKGSYGHVLAIAGAPGKTGAAAMTGLAALRMGAGLVTVASAAEAIPGIAVHAPELMTDVVSNSESAIRLARGKTAVAIGPGLGAEPETISMVRAVFEQLPLPLVVDADGLNSLAGSTFYASRAPRILTPHPGEMSRLAATSTAAVQADRIGCARRFAAERNVCVVLKGDRTVIAFPDGRAWINPTGSPAMATGGTGDLLTGMIAGAIAQFPNDLETAVIAAVWLHGRCGELAAEHSGEMSVIATDLLTFLPEAIRAVSNIH